MSRKLLAKGCADVVDATMYRASWWSVPRSVLDF